jgi:hypothetical protein
MNHISNALSTRAQDQMQIAQEQKENPPRATVRWDVYSWRPQGQRHLSVPVSEQRPDASISSLLLFVTIGRCVVIRCAISIAMA